MIKAIVFQPLHQNDVGCDAVVRSPSVSPMYILPFSSIKPFCSN